MFHFSRWENEQHHEEWVDIHLISRSCGTQFADPSLCWSAYKEQAIQIKQTPTSHDVLDGTENNSLCGALAYSAK
jgi:hypothetical protein